MDPQEYKIYQTGKAQGKDDAFIKGAILAYRASKGNAQQTTQAPSSGLASNIWTDIANRGQALSTALTTPHQTMLGNIAGGFDAAAQVAGGVTDVAGEIVKSTPVVSSLASFLGGIAQKGFNAVTDKLSSTKLFQEAAQAPGATKGLETWLNIAKSAGDISNSILTAEGARAGTQAVVDNAPELYKAMTARSEDAINERIIQNFNKGIKPSMAGKKTEAQMDKYRSDIVQGVKTIRDNKLNLNFTGDAEAGFEGTGQLPKTVQELSDAVEQTKKVIFDQYDSIARKASSKGLAVKTSDIASELDPIIGSKALSLANPKVIEYAKSLQKRLSNLGKLDVQTAQDVIQHYNKVLEAFYKNPTYENASNAAVDALVANKMRSLLDDSVSNLSGGEYSAIKRQYGSLKSIEKDVVKAALKQANKNTKGLLDYADIFSGGQVVNGILGLNPATFASGLAQKGITEYFKYLNDPNRAIKKMFDAAEEGQVAGTRIVAPK